MEILELLQDNPLLSAAAAAVLGGLVPVWRATQRALIRRIDQAWPDDKTNLSHSQKVDQTVKTLSTTIIPDSVIKNAVRRHKQ